jgi:hypothetical protein
MQGILPAGVNAAAGARRDGDGPGLRVHAAGAARRRTEALFPRPDRGAGAAGACPAWPRWRRRAAWCASTRSTSIRMRLEEQGITLDMLMMAVQQAGRDVGAMSVEQSGVETMIRGVGFIRSVADVENIVCRGDRTGAGLRSATLRTCDWAGSSARACWRTATRNTSAPSSACASRRIRSR